MQNINEEFLGEGVCDIQNAARAISLTKNYFDEVCQNSPKPGYSIIYKVILTSVVPKSKKMVYILNL
jgi:hypothetical protein